MLADLTAVLEAVPATAGQESYRRAILDENALGKKTASTRLWAWKKLRELYTLDTEIPVFRLLRRFWDMDTDGRPLMALLMALTRDGLLRTSVPAISSSKLGEVVTREQVIELVVAERGDRFSKTTIDSVVGNLLSSWSQSGHLMGRTEKVRTVVNSTPAATTLALAFGYLAGARGEFLFSSLWTSVIDAPPSTLQDHARHASRLGWLTYRGSGNIIEVTFPDIATQHELATQ